MNDDELALLNELLGGELGICFPDHKREILESRLRPRIAELRLRTFFDYYALLQHDSGNGRGEIARLAELVTNNESYFFRETYQFEALLHDGIDELRRSRHLRFLSAGCSSGEEAYTLNIFARESLFGADLAIDAFDVSRSRIAIADAAEYTQSSMRGVTAAQLERYFQAGEKSFLVRPAYRRGVTFRVGNLLHDAAYGAAGSYDVIFCRNVLIYFPEEMIRCAVERFHRALRPGGLLFLGHSESIIGMSTPFEPARIGRCIAYRRGEGS